MQTYMILPPPLTEAEEDLLLDQLAQQDDAARARLIEHNLHLVISVAQRYTNTVIDPDALIAIGTIGLIRAINKFKGHKGDFTAFIKNHIQIEILQHLYEAEIRRQEERSVS